MDLDQSENRPDDQEEKQKVDCAQCGHGTILAGFGAILAECSMDSGEILTDN